MATSKKGKKKNPPLPNLHPMGAGMGKMKKKIKKVKKAGY